MIVEGENSPKKVEVVCLEIVLCTCTEIFDFHPNIPGGMSVTVVDGTRDGEARSYGVTGR